MKCRNILVSALCAGTIAVASTTATFAATAEVTFGLEEMPADAPRCKLLAKTPGKLALDFLRTKAVTTDPAKIEVQNAAAAATLSVSNARFTQQPSGTLPSFTFTPVFRGPNVNSIELTRQLKLEEYSIDLTVVADDDMEFPNGAYTASVTVTCE